MPEEVMPADQVLAAKWKLTAMRKWLDEVFPPVARPGNLGGGSTVPRWPLGRLVNTLDDVIESLVDGEFVEGVLKDAPDWLAMGRYLVLCLIMYAADEDEAPDLDEYEWFVPGTLEDAQKQVEAHVFADVRNQYDHVCRVFDSHLRKELLFEEVQKIEWKL